MRLLWIAAALTVPIAVQARTLHNVPWYSAHEAARRATVELCESDARYADLPDCNNAEMAAAGRMFEHRAPIIRRQPHYNSLGQMLNDPEYWAANPVARAGGLRECAEGEGLSLPYCDAIRASLAIKP